MIKLENVIEQIEEFPTLPTIYTQLLEVMANPRSTVADVANIISQDISSSTKILKHVNSPFYHIQGEIDTISQAIFYIGFNEVKNLVITLSVLDIFNEKHSDSKFNIVDLWKHSIAVGVITRIIGQLIGIKNIENYFLSGVIHDIGKLFFLKTMKKEYTTVVDYVADKNVVIQNAEEKIFGFDHMLTGGLLAKKWKLPQTITNSIVNHNTGRVKDQADIQVSCVHLANIIARIMEFGFPGDDLVPQPNKEIWNFLNIDPATYPQILTKITDNYEQSLSILLLNDA
jgi:HD-like signal output (HDOD) protein